MGTFVETCRNLSRLRPEALAPPARPSATGLVLLAADSAALLASGWLGFRVWSLINHSITADFYLGLLPALAALPVVYAALGLYPGSGLNPVEELRSAVLGTTGGYLVFTASLFLSREVNSPSRGVFVCCWFFSAVTVPLGRAFARRVFAAKPWWGVPVLILGAGPSARKVLERLNSQPALGLKPVACLDDGESGQHECAGVPVSGSLALAPELSRVLHVRHAVVAMQELRRGQLMALIERMGGVFPHLIVVPDLFGMASLWVSTRDLGGVLSLEIRQNLLVPANRWVKRALDLAAAIGFGVVALPLMAAAVIWIRRVSPGPALYVQNREGKDGRTIRVWKLRTMYQDAEALLEEHLSRNPEARREWESYFKLRDDPRILPVIGRLLRRTSLDELPQLWNVLKGEMSMVGPRPFPYYHLEKFEKRFRALRSRVSPGLTGLWQISARSDGDLSVQEALDTYYIRNWSPWLDLHILARTVRAVLLRQGAY